jgi:hypothetical protein
VRVRSRVGAALLPAREELRLGLVQAWRAPARADAARWIDVDCNGPCRGRGTAHAACARGRGECDISRLRGTGVTEYLAGIPRVTPP